MPDGLAPPASPGATYRLRVRLDPGFALVETAAPRELLSKTLADVEVLRRYGITVACVKP